MLYQTINPSIHRRADQMRRLFQGASAILLLISSMAWAADGAAVYEKKCRMCHSIAGAGGPMAKMGGPLDGVAASHDAAWLGGYITDPKSKKADSKMPKLSLPDDDLNAVVSYLQSVKK